MKQVASTFIYLIQRWVIIFAVALAPLHAHSEAAQQLELPLAEQQLDLPFPKDNGLQIVKGDSSEDFSKLSAAEPIEVQDPAAPGKKTIAHALYDSTSTLEERKATSPKSLLQAFTNTAKNTFVSHTGADGKKQSGIIIGTAKSFPAEASTFYTAMGLLAVAELNYPMTSKNPAAIDQFIQQSFKDPVGAAGFYSFMLVNRQATHFFQQVSMIGGADPKNFSKIKRLFYTHMTPHIGMSAGFLAQTVFTELWQDKEFKMCVGRFGMKTINKVVGGKKIALAPDSPEILEACELAYDRWAVKQKIKDYIPLVAAMVATNILQMSGVPFAKWLGNKSGIGRAIVKTPGIGVHLGKMTMAFRKGARFVFPQGGILVRIASMVVFIKGSELVQPYFDKALGMPIKADDIADITNRFEQKLGDLANRNWEPIKYVDRKDQRANDPKELLKKIALQYQKMRQFHLQIPLANHANWQQALLEFQGAYTSSYAMYDRVISEVREYLDRDSRNRYVGPNPSQLFLSRESPIYRVGTLLAKKQSGPLAADPLRELLIRIREYYSHNGKKLNSDQDRVLRQINFGLEAAYRDLSANELEAAIKKAKLDSSKLTEEQRHSIAVEVRANRVTQALKLFDRLGSNVNKSGIGFKIASGVKGLINEVTGDVNKLSFNEFIYHLASNMRELNYVVTTTGYDYYHRELGTNKNIVSELAREATPKRYQQAYTPTMADYLLASMVCGPRASGGAAERSKQTTLLSKALSWWNEKDSKPFQSLSLVEHTPGFGWRFLPPRLVQDSIANANFCGRTPPRAKLHNIVTAAQEFITGRSVEKQNIDLRTFFNVNTGEYKVNGETHQGMLPLVKYFMNPQFLASAQGEDKPFYKYWVSNVEPQAKTALIQFQKSYRDLVFKEFVPRFTSGEYINRKGRKVHYGTGWSMLDEGTYYQGLLKRMIPTDEMESLLKTYKRNLQLSIALFSQTEKVKKATEIILKTIKEEQVQKAEEDQNAADILGEGLADLEEDTSKLEVTPEELAAVRTAADPAAQKATVRLLKAMEQNLKAISDLVEKTSLKGSAKNVAQQLVHNMTQVTGEAETYNGVIRAVNLQGLPEASDI